MYLKGNDPRQRPLSRARPVLRAVIACDTHTFDYFEDVTSECVMACTERAMRFCTPTLRMSLAT